MIHSIIPPYMLEHIAMSGKPGAEAAWNTMALTERLRGKREVWAKETHRTGRFPTVTFSEYRDIYSANGSQQTPGTAIRHEGQPDSSDISANQVYEGFGATFDLYQHYGRNSIDNRGLRLVGTIHYGQKYDNAFWNGQQMVFGDGDGVIFTSFTKPIDVMGHELTHGVTQYTANLNYQDQSGALNESISDVFGVLVKQRHLMQSADKADWLIGAGLLAPGINGVALRSMKAPGTAYNDPQLGKDPQPDNMSGYVQTTNDNGGVHVNSGIPNHAFYLAAVAIGGWAWEKTGRIWYRALRDVMQPSTNFQAAANATVTVAGSLFGIGGKIQMDVKNAWAGVGVNL